MSTIWETAGGQLRDAETFTVLMRQGTNMAHRGVAACINRAIVAGIRDAPSDHIISLDGDRVRVFRDASNKC